MKRYLLLALIAVGIVAFLSRMPYEQQTIIPELQTFLADRPFEQQLSRLELTYWGRTISIEESGYYYFIEFLIRKSAHFFGYGFIGIIIYMFYRRMRWRFPSFFAVATVFIIASLDELRQRFTPGRTGIFDDVLIDTAGAITCIFLLKIVIAIVNLIKPRVD